MVFVAVCRAIQFLLLLLMMRVATAVLVPEEMGRMSLIVTTTTFFALFLVNPVGMFINRRLHSWNSSGRVRQYLKVYYVYLMAIALIASLVIFFIQDLGIFDFHIETKWLVILIGGSLFFNTINQTAIPSLNMLGFRLSFMLLTLGTLICGFLAALFLVRNFSPKSEYWLLGLLFGQVIFSVIGSAVFSKKLKNSNERLVPSKLQIRSIMLFAWPLALAVGLNWIQTQGYRFILGEKLGLFSLGIFVAGYGLSAGVISGFESILTTYFQPYFYERLSGKNAEISPDIWHSYASAILPPIILVVWFLTSVSTELTKLLLSAQYQEASQFVIWGAIAEGIRVTVGTYGMAAHAKMNTKLLLVPNFIGALVSIVAVPMLIVRFGAIGAGIGLSIAAICVLIVMHKKMVHQGLISLPSKLLVMSFTMGAVLLLISILSKLLWHGPVTIWTAIVNLLLMGLIFSFMLYMLFRGTNWSTSSKDDTK